MCCNSLEGSGGRTGQALKSHSGGGRTFPEEMPQRHRAGWLQYARQCHGLQVKDCNRVLHSACTTADSEADKSAAGQIGCRPAWLEGQLLPMQALAAASFPGTECGILGSTEQDIKPGIRWRPWKRIQGSARNTASPCAGCPDSGKQSKLGQSTWTKAGAGDIPKLRDKKHTGAEWPDKSREGVAHPCPSGCCPLRVHLTSPISAMFRTIELSAVLARQQAPLSRGES